MSPITISDLPLELLYTILSHALADLLFEYLFVGSLLPTDDDSRAPTGLGDHDSLEEISSLGRVSVAWRITLHRILGAILNNNNQQHPNRDGVQSPRNQYHNRAHHQLTAWDHASTTSINRPIPISAWSAISATPVYSTIHSLTSQTGGTGPCTWMPDLVQYCRTLCAMQRALRDLVQHSIDTYRNEQDATSQPHQTGVTTPTLFPVPPIQTQTPAPPHPGTPPLLPHPIPLVSHPQSSFPPAAANGSPTAQHRNASDHLLGALLLVAAPALKGYATTPLFREALCYSQAAIFTCSSSTSFPYRPSRPSLSAPRVPRTTTADVVTARRPDLSTLVLTTARLVTALEWVRTCEEGYHRICPREMSDVVESGMRGVRERIEDAIKVCRWNDLLDTVFLRGERSEEMLEAIDGTFDELEANASSIQMHHLLRSNLFKTVQTISRMGPISLVGQTTPSAQSPLRTCGEVWESRSGALSLRWMGRVVEWTGD